MIYGIIPARLESTRLPRKMLLAETGKPLIQHTWEAAKRAMCLDDVIVATDSPDIVWAVEQFGGRVVLTGEHASGTERMAAIIPQLPDATIAVNIQGDEPDIDPVLINRVAVRLSESRDLDIVTVSAPLRPDDTVNPNVVKVRMQPCGQPDFCREINPRYRWRHHVGIYGFRVESLRKAVALPVVEAETEHRLEQLRWINAGFRWDVLHVHEPVIGGIDTPDDYRRFVERVRNG